MESPLQNDIPVTKQKLLNAVVNLVLRQGFNATTVDQICAEAGVTKGSFFHYFKTKEEIGLAATNCWADYGMAIYATAKKDPVSEPLDHIHRFFDIMIGMVRSTDEAVVCFIGMMAQELAGTNSKVQERCDAHLTEWSNFVSGMLAAAKKAQKLKIDFNPDEVAWMLNSLWQGSMLISKTRRNPETIVTNLQMARAFVESLFSGIATEPKNSRKPNPKSQKKEK